MNKPPYPPKPKRCFTKDHCPTKWFLCWQAKCDAIDAEHRAKLLSRLKSRAKITYSKGSGDSDWSERFKVK
jgi:hypothetical protein